MRTLCIYGAGNVKLGTVGSPKGLSQRKYMMIGKQRRAQFLKGLPALAKLTSRCEAAHKQRSSIRLIDGIRVLSSSAHSALNTLLQGSGAVIMKRAQVIAYDYVKDIAKFSATIHDEYQVHTISGDADRVGKLLAQAIKEAGEYYKMNVPLSGAYSIGKNWMETH